MSKVRISEETGKQVRSCSVRVLILVMSCLCPTGPSKSEDMEMSVKASTCSIRKLLQLYDENRIDLFTASSPPTILVTTSVENFSPHPGQELPV